MTSFLRKVKGIARRVPVLGPMARSAWYHLALPAKYDAMMGQLADLRRQVDVLASRTASPDGLCEGLGRLRQLLSGAEMYQPLYGLPGHFFARPARDCRDRAEAIERALAPCGRRLRIADFGSSLGYFCFYLADRGARATGFDAEPACASIARLTALLNGLEAQFHNRRLDAALVSEIEPAQYDAGLLLSVMHHVIAANGLGEAQCLLADLSERIPLLVLELATAREPENLAWQGRLPRDEMDVLARCRDVEIQSLGEFATHLSDARRPMVLVRRKTVAVNHVVYAYQRMSTEAYPGSRNISRQFFTCPEVFIKRYRLEDGGLARDRQQIIREVFASESLAGCPDFARLRDYEFTPDTMTLVYDRIEGRNLLETLLEGQKLDVLACATDMLRAARSLRKAGLYHNDIRTWNILHDGGRFRVIDLGFAGPTETDRTTWSVLWVLHDMVNPPTGAEHLWPLTAPPTMKIEDYPESVRPLARSLLESASFDDWLAKHGREFLD